jgi:hypothetical protein
MALRDQPYLPLYVQDYLSDEKLSCCSLSTQGVYIRILCVLHKSETYGGILFKQIPKQNFSSMQYFAWSLSKQTGIEYNNVVESIEELLLFKVLKIEEREGVDFLFQKRMVKDFNTSEKRRTAGKKGGGNPNLFKQNPKQVDKHNFKQTDKQNTEYEYVNEDENVNTLKGGTGGKVETPNVENHCTEGEDTFDGRKSEKSSQEFAEAEIYELSFENIWAVYGKKGNKKSSQRRWDGLPKKAKLLAVAHIPRYVAATPEIQYRKNFETYINQEAWNDQIITKNETESRFTSSKNANSMGNGYSGNGANTFRTDAERRRNERQMLAQMATAVLQQPETKKD